MDIAIPSVHNLPKLRLQSLNSKSKPINLLALDPIPHQILLINTLKPKPLSPIHMFPNLILNNTIIILSLPDLILDMAKPGLPIADNLFHF